MEQKRNFSRKREAVLRAVRSTTTHPTAEWVYQTLKPEYPDLSLGTVYRNLAQFKEDGVIISVGIVNGQERFDGNVQPHTHFVCSQCGAVLDIADDRPDPGCIERIARNNHIRIDAADIMLRGVCSECLSRKDGKIGS